MMDFILLLIAANSLVAACVYFIISRIWGNPDWRALNTAPPVSTPYAQQALRACYQLNDIALEASPPGTAAVPPPRDPLAIAGHGDCSGHTKTAVTAEPPCPSAPSP